MIHKAGRELSNTALTLAQQPLLIEFTNHIHRTALMYGEIFWSLCLECVESRSQKRGGGGGVGLGRGSGEEFRRGGGMKFRGGSRAEFKGGCGEAGRDGDSRGHTEKTLTSQRHHSLDKALRKDALPQSTPAT